MSETIHVVPENDTKEHTEDADCACKPVIRYVNNGRIIIHNSYDGREIVEKWEEDKERFIQ